MTDPKDPAYPPSDLRVPGLTKREYFAAMALQGYRSNLDYTDSSAQNVARLAVWDADALIAELNK